MAVSLHIFFMQSPPATTVSLTESWLGIVLASAAVSALVSGAVQLWVTWWQAKQHVKRRFEDELVTRRVEANRKLLELVIKVDHAVQPMRDGLTGFQSGTIGHLPSADEPPSQAYVDKSNALADLERFIAHEELILGREITATWNFFAGALIELEWQTEDPHRQELFFTMLYATRTFANAMRKAMHESLKSAQPSILTTDERHAQNRAGHKWIKNLLEQVKADPKKYSFASRSYELHVASERILKKNAPELPR